MKQILTTTILLYALALQANIDHSGDVTFISNSKRLPNKTLQEQIKREPVWQEYSKKYGIAYVEFDELTHMPHRVSGSPIEVDFRESSFEQDVKNFLNEELKMFNIPTNDLKLVRNRTNLDYRYINLKQYYQNIEVVNSAVTLRVKNASKLTMFGLDIYNDIDLNIEPTISIDDAKTSSMVGIQGSYKSTTHGLKVLPIPTESKYTYHLVYEIENELINEKVGDYYSLVDAHTGVLLYRQNRLVYADNVSATITGTVYPEHPDQGTMEVPLKDLRINHNGAKYTDENGTIAFTDTMSFSTNVPLRGKWCYVFDNHLGQTVSFDTVFEPGQDSFSFTGLADIGHIGMYYHVNQVHDHVNKWLPSFTGMDIQIEANVELDPATLGSPSGCNAFYVNNTVNFFIDDPNCSSFDAFNDVIYHEYGHGINRNFYQDNGAGFMFNGALNEAYADIWALSLTKNPILSEHILGFGTTIRRYDQNPKVYPQDLIGEVHADGEIIAGAWWDLGQELDSIELMMEIFSGAFYGLSDGSNGTEGQVYRDALLEAILFDDDDADITNGTPHIQEILTAFAIHGIVLLDGALIHDELTSANADQAIGFGAMLSSLALYIETPQLYYKTSYDATWKSVEVEDIGSGQLNAIIPSQPAGTIIDYYFEISDAISGVAATVPDGVTGVSDPKLLYQTLVGFELIKQDNLDTESGWDLSAIDDDARKGEWEIGIPVASYNNNITIQPDRGNTNSAFGDACAFTENASNVFDSPFSRDVDDGKTTLTSPVFELTNITEPVISYYRWFTNDQGPHPGEDYFRTYISPNGIDWTLVEETSTSENNWRRYAYKIKDYLNSASSIQLRFVVEDEGDESLVEAAIDDVILYGMKSEGSTASNTVENIYPNPTRDKVTFLIKGETGKKVDIKIADITGHVLHEQSQVVNIDELITLSLGSFESGFYFIEIEDQQETITKRVSLIH